jgi:putative methylase
VRRSELVRALARLEGFDRPRADLEQLATPPELAAEMLGEAHARGDLAGRSVLDLGSGTGILAIGAAWLGARPVIGIERDAAAVRIAEASAARAGVEVEWRAVDVGACAERADTVLMNPPFGAQRRHADRPFWEAAFRCARGRIYAFSLAASRTFIARRGVEHAASILTTRPVRWVLPASLPHHRKPAAEIPVDLWVFEGGTGT